MKEKFYRFMQGRYGVDTFNQHLLYFIIALFIINLIFNSAIISILSYVLWFFVLTRFLSRNTTKRYQENVAYLELIKPITLFVALVKKQTSDRNNKYYRCKKCKQLVRVPKGRGKIIITCPKCKNSFERRT